MDNLKYYNHSLAYDYSLFAERQSSAHKDNIVKLEEVKAKKVKAQTKEVKTQNKKATKKAAHKISSKLGAFVGTFMVVALILGNLALRAQVTSVTKQINDVKKVVNELQGQETQLNVEYENRISYQNLESAATSLGMKKMDKSQVVYIRVNDFNVAKTGDGELIDANN